MDFLSGLELARVFHIWPQEFQGPLLPQSIQQLLKFSGLFINLLFFFQLWLLHLAHRNLFFRSNPLETVARSMQRSSAADAFTGHSDAAEGPFVEPEIGLMQFCQENGVKGGPTRDGLTME